MPLAFGVGSELVPVLVHWAPILNPPDPPNFPDGHYPERFGQLVDFVWLNGHRTPYGLWLYLDGAQRGEDTAQYVVDTTSAAYFLALVFGATPEQLHDEANRSIGALNAIPAIPDLVYRFIIEVLHDNPANYGL